MDFKNIIGNREAKEYLKNSIKEGNILHSYLFLGTDGIGKKMIAKEFAKNILCNNTEEEICTCKSCTYFLSDNHPDFFLINDEGETIKIDQIRKITEKIIEKPIISDKKVYIINNAEKMTKEAQNCLLKTLEEPPEYVVIILISSNENVILNTIKSRCMMLKFKDISEEDLRKFATEILDYEDLTDNLLKSFGGSIGRAINLKENSKKYISLENFVKSLSKDDIIDIMVSAKIIYDKENINDILDYLTVCLFDVSRENKQYLNCIKLVSECKNRLKANANFDMTIDNLVLKMWEEVNESSCRHQV